MTKAACHRYVPPLTSLGILALTLFTQACAEPAGVTKKKASVSNVHGGDPADVANPAADAGTGHAEATSPIPCDPSETARLEQALIEATPPGVNSSAVVRTKCGARFFTAGPAAYGPNTLHRIGSVTKTYVGALMTLLVRDGTVHLDDTVSRWIGGVPNGDRITVRQLLTHRSGLYNYNDDTVINQAYSPEDLLAILVRHAPIAEPDERFEYSNSGFLLCGLIAEAATGQSLGALFRSRLFEPLHLTQTFFYPEPPTPGLTLAPSLDDKGEDLGHLDPSWTWAAGAMMATPTDGARWIEALGSGELFHDPSTQSLWLTPAPTADPETTYGLGIFVSPSSIGRLLWHRGDMSGYHSSATYVPDHQIALFAVVDHEPAPDVIEVLPITNALFQTLVPVTP